MSAIIFDFDGTIADSRDFVIKFIAQEAKLHPLTLEEEHALYGLSVIGIARHLGYKWWQLPGLFLKGRKRMGRVMANVKPFPGMVETIHKLHAEGHELFIVSSNSVRNIRSFLKHHNLRNQFLEIYGGIEVFGKAPVFRQLISDHNFTNREVVCVGDELRDIEAAQAAGIRTIAVTWGFARPSDIAGLNPTGIAQAPNDIVNLMSEI